MSIDELCALPVAELAAKDSALFMWATFPQLPEALRLIRAWGFTYKSVAFVWLKKNKKADSWFYGLGFWTRANAEVCLLATKGHPKRQAADIHQFIISPIEAHSANRAPLKKSENVLVFYQKSPVYHPQFTYGELYRKTNPRSGCSTNYGKFERTGSESSDGRRYPGNVLFVPTVTGGVHPTQKPVELCEYFIKTYTDEGAVVADICAGSGTTAVAAMNTGRRFICFENAPSIYTIAAQRIEQARLAVAGGRKGE